MADTTSPSHSELTPHPVATAFAPPAESTEEATSPGEHPTITEPVIAQTPVASKPTQKPRPKRTRNANGSTTHKNSRVVTNVAVTEATDAPVDLLDRFERGWENLSTRVGSQTLNVAMVAGLVIIIVMANWITATPSTPEPVARPLTAAVTSTTTAAVAVPTVATTSTTDTTAATNTPNDTVTLATNAAATTPPATETATATTTATTDIPTAAAPAPATTPTAIASATATPTATPTATASATVSLPVAAAVTTAPSNATASPTAATTPPATGTDTAQAVVTPPSPATSTSTATTATTVTPEPVTATAATTAAPTAQPTGIKLQAGNAITAELNPLPNATENSVATAAAKTAPPPTKAATTSKPTPTKTVATPAVKRTTKVGASRYTREIARLRRDRTAYEQELKKLGGVKGRPDPFTSGGPKDLDSEAARMQYHRANTSSTAIRTTTIHPAAQPPAPKKSK
ncbi:MAG: hypothetical protein HY696_11905 [Deltaproteobacteria bacterium]|nr:hypothetical protein [Deltaproteobacteria bacterium]